MFPSQIIEFSIEDHLNPILIHASHTYFVIVPKFQIYLATIPKFQMLCLSS